MKENNNSFISEICWDVNRLTQNLWKWHSLFNLVSEEEKWFVRHRIYKKKNVTYSTLNIWKEHKLLRESLEEISFVSHKICERDIICSTQITWWIISSTQNLWQKQFVEIRISEETYFVQHIIHRRELFVHHSIYGGYLIC